MSKSTWGYAPFGEWCGDVAVGTNHPIAAITAAGVRDLFCRALQVFTSLRDEPPECFRELKQLCRNPNWWRRQYLRDVETIVGRFVAEGIPFLQRVLSVYGSSLLGWAEMGSFEPVPGLSARNGIPDLLGLPLRILFWSNDSVLFAKLAQVLNLWKKLAGEMPKESQNQFITAFVDRATDTHVGPSDPLANEIATAALSAFTPRWDKPRHGTGAVSEGVKGDDKWEWDVGERPGSEPDLREIWLRSMGSVTRSHLAAVLASPSTSPLTNWHPDASSTGFPVDRRQDNAFARVVFVPKDYKSLRTVACMPVRQMFWSQALRSELYGFIEASSVLGGRVGLTDQTVNRQKCADLSFATIDLSEASDRLRWATVVEVLSGTPLLRALSSLRVDTLRIDPKIGEFPDFTITTYAPMGDALTFPVQGVVYWCLAVAYLTRMSGSRSWRNHVGSVFVFGDDIILPREHAVGFMDELERIGFRVNRSKSFYRGAFRESCGNYHYRGVDFELVRPRTAPPLRRSHSDPAIPIWCDYAHALLAIGLEHAARAVCDHIRSLGLVIPYGDRGQRWLTLPFPEAPTIRRVRARWNPHLQYWEEKRWVWAPLKRSKTRLDGHSRLLRNLLVPPTEPELSSSVVAGTSRDERGYLRLSWAPFRELAYDDRNIDRGH